MVLVASAPVVVSAAAARSAAAPARRVREVVCMGFT
ncbi:hypothetical protein Ae406Ps2_6231 [Pseudonocardia sp. Ae406_Ps2]|nr:hypothetical protein Ae406Ps2_6231 [Pseudonocardia sp. Ae406_Ps2]